MNGKKDSYFSGDDHKYLQSCDRYFSNFISRMLDAEDADLKDILICLSYSSRHGNICLETKVNDDQAGGGTVEKFIQAASASHLNISRKTDIKLKEKFSLQDGKTDQPVIYEKNRLYISKFYIYEHFIADAMIKKSKNIWQISGGKIENDAVLKFFPELTDQDQKEAALLSLRSKFSIISGGPGTGKTTTVVKILALHLLNNENLKIELAAPTGKAALRLQQSIQNSRKLLSEMDIDDSIIEKIPDRVNTLHRLLRYDGKKFYADRNHKINADLIVIDESSMMDIRIFYGLLDALHEDAGLILIGDHFQLASVEAGSILGDICGSYGKSEYMLSENIAELKFSRRFDGNRGIGRLSSMLRNKKDTETIFFNDIIECVQDSPEELKYFPENFKEEFIEIIREGFSGIMNANSPQRALESLDDFRILSPHRKGSRGVESINNFVTEYFFRSHLLKKSGYYYHKMPVQILKNDYSLSLFNGDTGILWENEDGIKAYFSDPDSPEGVRIFSPDLISEFEPCFAITVHKSQGSEFHSVLLMMPENPSPILSAELFYTALTRAKKKFYLSAKNSIIEESVNRRIERSSGLREILKKQEEAG